MRASIASARRTPQGIRDPARRPDRRRRATPGLQRDHSYAHGLEDGGGKTFDDKTGGWLGITDKYWASAARPGPEDALSRASFKGSSRSAERAGVLSGRLPVATPSSSPPGQTQKVEAHLFAGAKQVKLIEDYEVNLGIQKFDLLIDWGWFYFITKPLYYLLDWLYGILGNFGLAILAVTVLVQGCVLPARQQAATRAWPR